MNLIYFQLAIIASMVFSWLLVRTKIIAWKHLPLAVAVIWTSETFVKVETFALTILQIAVIWITWFALKHIQQISKTKKNKLDIAKQQTISLLPPESHKYIENARFNTSSVLNNDKSHHKELEAVFRNANEEIIISSGWISHHVVDSIFCKRLTEVLMRGVNVRLIFGYHIKEQEKQRKSKERAIKSILNAKQIANKSHLSGNIHLHDVASQYNGKKGTHIKAIVCDRKYVIVGSHNWLSNKYFKSEELSLKIQDPEVIKSVVNSLVKLL